MPINCYTDLESAWRSNKHLLAFERGKRKECDFQLLMWSVIWKYVDFNPYEILEVKVRRLSEVNVLPNLNETPSKGNRDMEETLTFGDIAE